MSDLQVSRPTCLWANDLALTSSRIRRKKCDEARPARSTCIKAQWKCDFTSSPSTDAPQEPQEAAPCISSLQYPYARPLLDDERSHMDYFQDVCARDFSLYFELPIWENIILQATRSEPALHHAALAIGALTSSRYHPASHRASSTTSFSIGQYGLAIQALQDRLHTAPHNLELAVLASVTFSLIEFLSGLDSQVHLHLQAGCAMLENLYISHTSDSQLLAQMNSDNLVESSPTYGLLANAMLQLTAQANTSMAYAVTQRQTLR